MTGWLIRLGLLGVMTFLIYIAAEFLLFVTSVHGNKMELLFLISLPHLK